ncbi:MAG: endonuclease/exonuclease/phosphatase family protein [Flavobacterium sp.]|nr:MAG: endonuclease/exonuclease/phosphatase family protein [Flavobacterium sp.]
MRISYLFFLILFNWPNLIYPQENRSFKIHTIAFYNLENLFDFEDDPITFDNDRTPEGKDHWTEDIYLKKVWNMATVISEIGKEITGQSPSIIGVCEIENRRVLEDLLNAGPLRETDYRLVHFDSPDRRGIDVALLYKKSVFVPSHYKAVELLLFDDHDSTKRIFTRDQLIVSGYLEGELIHIIVNHWPSRSGGEARSQSKRIKAARLNKQLIDSLWSVDPYAKIINMGDFNDDPVNASIKRTLKTTMKKDTSQLKKMYNPMEPMYRKGLGTLAYADGWNLFDQIMLSSELLKKDYSTYRFYTAGIYNSRKLIAREGRYKGYPFRSFTASGFTGGYSDHFPVFVYLIKETEASATNTN